MGAMHSHIWIGWPKKTQAFWCFYHLVNIRSPKKPPPYKGIFSLILFWARMMLSRANLSLEHGMVCVCPTMYSIKYGLGASKKGSWKTHHRCQTGLNPTWSALLARRPPWSGPAGHRCAHPWRSLGARCRFGDVGSLEGPFMPAWSDATPASSIGGVIVAPPTFILFCRTAVGSCHTNPFHDMPAQ